MDFFDKLSKKASETYKVTAEKTTKIAKETKLKLEISNYKSNMEDLYKIVGKKIYQKYAAQEEMQLEDIQDELNKLEFQYIKDYDAVNSDDYYNISEGGTVHTYLKSINN